MCVNKVRKTIYCPSCKGTGLFQGFFEPYNGAVQCTNCEGSGAVTDYVDIITQTFEGKKPTPEHIKVIYPSNRDGNYYDETVTIEDFNAGIMPQKKNRK